MESELDMVITLNNFEANMREAKRLNLLPCPFCGATAELVEDEILGNRRWWIGCSGEQCGMDGVRTVYHQLEKDAVATWNRRAPVQQTTPAVQNEIGK